MLYWDGAVLHGNVYANHDHERLPVLEAVTNMPAVVVNHGSGKSDVHHLLRACDAMFHSVPSGPRAVLDLLPQRQTVLCLVALLLRLMH